MKDKEGRLIVDLPPKTVSRVVAVYTLAHHLVLDNADTAGGSAGARLFTTRASNLQAPRGTCQETVNSTLCGGKSNVELYLHLGNVDEVGGYTDCKAVVPLL